MSTSVGDRLPEQLLRAFDGTGLRDKIGLAYLLVTTDPDGTPRPCMLSAGQIVTPDDRRYRVGLWAGTHTGDNLARGGSALLCYVERGLVVYVKGRGRALPGVEGEDTARFEVDVERVETDVHEGMPIAAPMTFALDGPDPDEVTRDWERMIEVLRADAPSA